jgi:hypothetical protein
VWCKNTNRHPMPAPSNPRPQAMPPARRFAVLGGLARGTEKGGRRGTQGNGGWGNPNGMNVGWGIGGGGAEEILRSTPEEVFALCPDQEFREKSENFARFGTRFAGVEPLLVLPNQGMTQCQVLITP